MMQYASSLDPNDDGSYNPLRYYADILNFVFNALFVVELGIRSAFLPLAHLCVYGCSLTVAAVFTVRILPLISPSFCDSMFVLWWRPFFQQPWKIFDLLIVISSLLALTPWVNIPSEVHSCTIFRLCTDFVMPSTYHPDVLH